MTYSRPAGWVWRSRRWSLWCCGTEAHPFGILAALVVLAILPDTVFNRILTIFNTSDTSNSRFPCIRRRGEFLQQRPVLGAGLGSDAGAAGHRRFESLPRKDHFVHCHNIYLQVWCETGLVGVISFVGGILWTFKKGCRAVARPPRPGGPYDHPGRGRRADGNHGLRPGRLYLELSPGDAHFLVRLCPDPGGHPPGGPAGWEETSALCLSKRRPQ